MPRLRMSPWVPVGLCLFYHLDPWGSFLPFLLAVLVHELGHIVAIIFVCGKVTAIDIHLGGAILETAPLTYNQEIFCAMSGPVSGLIFGFLFRKVQPWFWYWTMLHSLYNLLPIYPLDGGRALRAAFCKYLPLGKAEALSHAVTILFFCIFTLFCFLFPMPQFPFFWKIIPVSLLFLQFFP